MSVTTSQITDSHTVQPFALLTIWEGNLPVTDGSPDQGRATSVSWCHNGVSDYRGEYEYS